MNKLQFRQLIREEIRKELKESKRRQNLREGLFDFIGKIFSKGKSSAPEESDNVSADNSGVNFNGKRFKPDQIQYADYNDTKPIPRIEGNMLIVANPYWS